jgi:hypothetical protein
MRLCVALALAALLSGCRLATFGRNIETNAAALTPAGMNGVVIVRDSTYRGELIAIQNEALLLATSNELIEVPFTAIEVADFRPVAHTEAAPLRDQLERLRLVARHPYGVPADVMQNLLRKYEQSAARRITTP